MKPTVSKFRLCYLIHYLTQLQAMGIKIKALRFMLCTDSDPTSRDIFKTMDSIHEDDPFFITYGSKVIWKWKMLMDNDGQYFVDIGIDFPEATKDETEWEELMKIWNERYDEALRIMAPNIHSNYRDLILSQLSGILKWNGAMKKSTFVTGELKEVIPHKNHFTLVIESSIYHQRLTFNSKYTYTVNAMAWTLHPHMSLS